MQIDTDVIANALPCPFCGAYAQMFCKHTDQDYYFVQCGSCEAEGPPKWLMEEAAKAWNDRALPAPPKEDGE